MIAAVVVGCCVVIAAIGGIKYGRSTEAQRWRDAADDYADQGLWSLFADDHRVLSAGRFYVVMHPNDMPATPKRDSRGRFVA